MKLVPKVEKLSIYDSSAPTGHRIRPRQWLWNHQFGTWIKRNILPADDGKGPHATSTSGLPPLGLEAKIDIDRERSLYPSCVSHYLDRPVVSPDLSRRETAGSTSLLLDMERNLWNRSVSSEIGHEKLLTLPHLLQMVCVLLRRFPKELVPLVILEPHTTTLKHVGSWKLGAKDQGSRLLSLHIIAHRFIITEGQMFRTSASGRTTWKIHSSMYD